VKNITFVPLSQKLDEKKGKIKKLGGENEKK